MRFLLLAAALLIAACGAPEPEEPAPPPAPAAPAAPPASAASGGTVPASIQPCFGCHAEVVTEYLGHGMLGSVGRLGSVETIETGVVTHSDTGVRYELAVENGSAWLTAAYPGGGTRRQRLVGRIGAGRFDTSWATMEVDPRTGRDTGRLFFAPVETVTAHGLELSPFELHPSPQGATPGMDMALSQPCLTCHTDSRLTRLPGAAAGNEGDHVYPANALGARAFEHLEPLTCGACHGDTSRHLAMLAGEIEEEKDLGIARLGQLDAGRQRDVCARCHLQGDARIELVDMPPTGDQPLAGQVPVLIPARPPADHRFVGQLERLSRSRCFAESPEMTCTTCHRPHTGAAAQGTASFDAACLACHGGMEEKHTGRTVEEVTGSPARTALGCVDCHVRRSQPYDLPHLTTADHFIRREIPRPVHDLPHRQFGDPDGPVEIYDDGRLGEALATPAGKRWAGGVRAMGVLTMGRFEEARRGFASFPAPGSEDARRPSAPAGLVPLETQPAFHQLRALTLQASGDFAGALAAYGDALTLDPTDPGARMGRARVRLDTGDVRGALVDSDYVVANYPQAEAPWLLRAEVALRARQPQLAADALTKATELWPANPATWHQLGLVLQAVGRRQEADEAFQRARELAPAVSAAVR